MEYVAVFIPNKMDYLGNFRNDFDEAILFTEEKELCFFINNLVDTFGEECGWSSDSINSAKKSLIEGFEEECFGIVIYPEINKSFT